MFMTMQMRGGVLAVLVLSGGALGEPPAPAPEAQALATVEAILQNCARLHPEAAEQYQATAKQLTQGADEETLAQLRSSDEYVTSHGVAVEALAKVSDNDAERSCAQSLVQGR